MNAARIGTAADDNDSVNVAALVRGSERYIVLYPDCKRCEALRAVGRLASNPDLSFSWYDAAQLAMRIREGI
jgi:hypothetical protein